MAAAGYVFGCATDPVTGKKQLMLVSEDTEVQIDRQYSPLQISSDYGAAQDSQLNSYVSEVGKEMAAKSHRPQMPYSFRVVNATYVNAYAFPGGTIAATRGIMLSLENEAELAALRDEVLLGLLTDAMERGGVHPQAPAPRAFVERDRPGVIDQSAGVGASRTVSSPSGPNSTTPSKRARLLDASAMATT